MHLDKPLRNHRKTMRNHRGLTLIELLIVVTLLITIASIAIPAVRLINKERKTRETARQVTAAFASARDSATVTGFGGVELVRNTNYIDVVNGERVHFASTVLYGLKSLPVFAGDLVGAGVVEIRLNDDALTPNEIEYEIQLDAVPSIETGRNPISANDTIRIDYRGPRHRIIAVDFSSTANPFLTVAVPTSYPPLPVGSFAAGALPGYQIYRKPVRDESSRIELPRGMYVDLRLSGPLDTGDVDSNPGSTGTAPGTPTLFGLDEAHTGTNGFRASVVLLYDKSGGVDQVLTNGLTPDSFQLHSQRTHLFASGPRSLRGKEPDRQPG